MISRFRPAVPTHLLPALAAAAVAVLLLAGLETRAQARLKRFGPALASLNLPAASRGTVLQQRIFALPDCLPIYGSSELSVDQPTRADRFFRRKQQGFDAFVFGQPGDRCLTMSQELASLGEAARGRKVAVFLSPGWFLPTRESEQRDHAAHRQFAAAFSPLQAGRLAVESPLGTALKRRLAGRLTDYDAVIRERSPLLATALVALTENSWPGRCGFAVLRPLLGMQNLILAWQERVHWLEVIRDRPALRAAGAGFRSRRKHLEWSQLDRDVDHLELKRTRPTFYSRAAVLDDPSAERRDASRAPNEPDRDADFLRRMNASPEWEDLGLLLAVAKELDVRLLLVGQPINGLYSDAQGITPQARREYYRRLSRTAGAFRVRLRDFSAFEEDRAFFMDVVHPSAEAWAHYDEILAQFFRPGRS